jgi:AcrR family transcriptional regulator
MTSTARTDRMGDSMARTGRANQKARTRTAIVEAARELMRAGVELSMPAVARAALVSEATAYRYFPDMVSLLRETVVGVWPSPAESLEPVAHIDDPVERVGYATEVLLRGVLTYQGAVRAMISAAITKPGWAAARPGHRFGLIDEALAPLAATPGRISPQALEQLKRDLAVVVSAEALFVLTDLCGLPPDDAIASAIHTARTLTAATTRELPARRPQFRRPGVTSRHAPPPAHDHAAFPARTAAPFGDHVKFAGEYDGFITGS